MLVVKGCRVLEGMLWISRAASPSWRMRGICRLQITEIYMSGTLDQVVRDWAARPSDMATTMGYLQLRSGSSVGDKANDGMKVGFGGEATHYSAKAVACI